MDPAVLWDAGRSWNLSSSQCCLLPPLLLLQPLSCSSHRAAVGTKGIFGSSDAFLHKALPFPTPYPRGSQLPRSHLLVFKLPGNCMEAQKPFLGRCCCFCSSLGVGAPPKGWGSKQGAHGFGS